MTSPYHEALNRIALAEQMLIAGSPAGASIALDEAHKLAQEVGSPKRLLLNTLIAHGRDDVTAAVPRSYDDWAHLSDRIADGGWVE